MGFSNKDLATFKDDLEGNVSPKMSALLHRLECAEAVINSQWEHRCSDKIGGGTMISNVVENAWLLSKSEGEEGL